MRFLNLAATLTTSALSLTALRAPAFPQPAQFADRDLTTVDPPTLDSTSALRTYHPKILLLRHGEKKKDGSVGLNAKGKKRAKCLRKVLGAKGKHNVGLILAEAYNPETRKRMRPYLTVKRLAQDLGLKVDTDCDVEDAKCVRKKVKKYVEAGGKGEVVICWKHSMLHRIAEELGAPRTSPYPDHRYDIIWTLHHNRIVTKESEQCPGIDTPTKKGKKDPDLEIDPGHFSLDDVAVALDPSLREGSGDDQGEQMEEEDEDSDFLEAQNAYGQLILADID
ncbi:hypothetical protein JCM11641_000596 [Rhodosporidiobolus odoratus]